MAQLSFEGLVVAIDDPSLMRFLGEFPNVWGHLHTFPVLFVHYLVIVGEGGWELGAHLIQESVVHQLHAVLVWFKSSLACLSFRASDAMLIKDVKIIVYFEGIWSELILRTKNYYWLVVPFSKTF